MSWLKKVVGKENGSPRTVTDDDRQRAKEREALQRRLKVLQMEVEVMQRRAE